MRRELTAYLLDTDASANPVASGRSNYHEAQGRAMQAARQAVLAMRDSDEIGDDAFHRIEEELDWLEMAGQSLDR